MKELNKQSKKNLKARAKRIFESIRMNSSFPLAMSYVGSFNEKGPMKQREDGSYDLDIDISSKFIRKGTTIIEEPGTIMNQMNKIIKDNLRSNEIKKQKSRVIFVFNDTNGYKYNLDISFKLIENGEISKTIVYKDGKYEWE